MGVITKRDGQDQTNQREIEHEADLRHRKLFGRITRLPKRAPSHIFD